MSAITFQIGGPELLDAVGPLWTKLNKHHAQVSPHFFDRFQSTLFDVRKRDLMEKSMQGKFRIELATDSDRNQTVGYCIGSINTAHQGEIDSIYIEPSYRNRGIAHQLMERMLGWMDEQQTARKTVVVVTGNEDVFSFYQRYGFFPRVHVLSQIPPT